MAITPRPKKEPRPELLTVRISKKANDELYKLKPILNLTRGEIVDLLITEEFKRHARKVK